MAFHAWSLFIQQLEFPDDFAILASVLTGIRTQGDPSDINTWKSSELSLV